MSLVDPSSVRRIAHLARLRFTDEEVEDYGAELAKILDHVAVLETLPEASGARSETRLSTPERKDEVTQTGDAQQNLSNAPDQSGSYFRVPLVIGEES
jgi:aspartyl-tRNA(Asn)/glutamyl-tRNA(Gln) amidotransferase subunit C